MGHNARGKFRKNPRRFWGISMQLFVWILALISLTMLQVVAFWARGYVLNEIYHRV